MNYYASAYCMNLFSPMKSVWHNNTIHLKFSTSSVLIGYAFLQMSYNLSRGRGIGDEEQLPPPLSPLVPAELMQMVVESQRMLVEAMR
jgi:hypothetical protein